MVRTAAIEQVTAELVQVRQLTKNGSSGWRKQKRRVTQREKRKRKEKWKEKVIHIWCYNDAGNEVYCRQDNHLAYGANRHKR